MTKEQLEAIVGMIAGVQMGIIHLVKVLQHQGVLDESFAAALLATADAVPPGTRNADKIAMVLRHLASGIENATSLPNQEELKKLIN